MKINSRSGALGPALGESGLPGHELFAAGPTSTNNARLQRHADNLEEPNWCGF